MVIKEIQLWQSAIDLEIKRRREKGREAEIE